MLLNNRIPAWFIANKVKYDFIYVLIVSMIVFFITDIIRVDLPDMPLTIPTFIGTAISILLSFKLNQSYDRWWEARKVWGSIVNDSRSLVLQLQSLVAPGNESIIKKIAFRQIAWCYCLGQALRGTNPAEGLEHYMDADDLQQLQRHSNKALAILKQHGQDIKTLKETNQLDIFAQIQFDNTIVRLCDAQGKAERIKTTIFPVTYRLFLHYIIYLFVITLSISLKEIAAYYEVPLLLLISTAFFLLEKTATHMQDPFENRPTDTAVSAIARTIEINIKQLLNETDVPKPVVPNDFYLL